MIHTPDQRLRVFVSSTLDELAPERAAAKAAVSQLRLTPVLFESGARPHPPRALYQAYLAQSDIFIGLYWQRYGWVAPAMPVSGLEDEYESAGDKPKLVYVKIPAPDREPRLQALLDRIKDRSTVSYQKFSTADELRELVANDLALLMTERFASTRATRDRLATPPVRHSPLIGRVREVAEIEALLRRDDVGLVTLTGPGGVGKTRLAEQIASDIAADFANGSVFVTLAPLAEPVAGAVERLQIDTPAVSVPPAPNAGPSLVASAIARAVGVREILGNHPLLESVKDYLREKHMLMLLDNFEHVVSAAPLVGELLAASPRLKVLVTSRSSLRLREERVVPIPPLALPDLAHLPAPRDLLQYAAVDLFVQRASSVRPDFGITDENAAAVAAICVHLDGLPLAIELAAARINVLPPTVLLPRLEKRFEVLRAGTRDLPPRLQTLRSAIDWSYDLLDQGAQTLFRRLAVFAGGWTVEAAEGVCNIDGDLGADVLDQLETLIDSSLVTQAEAARGAPRHAILETIREYAILRLADSSSREQDVLHRRHADFFLALAERAEPHLTSGGRGPWLAQLEVEYDNLRAALEWCSVTTGEHEKELRLATALGWFWYFGGHLREGRDWIEHALARTEVPPRTAIRAKGLYNSGALARVQGDYAAARARLEEAVALTREIGDRPGLAYALIFLGILEITQGNPKAAQAQFTESLGILRNSGTRWWQAFALRRLGEVLLVSGEPQAAHSPLEESIAIFRSVDDPWGTAVVLNSLGRLAEAEGHYAAARSLYGESMGLFRRDSDIWGRGTTALFWDLMFPLELMVGQGFGALHRGAYEDAKAIYEERMRQWREIGNQTGTVLSLIGFAALALARGQPQPSPEQDESGFRQARRGTVLLAAADGLAKTRGFRQGFRLFLRDQAEFDHWLAAAHAQLDDAAFAAAWAEGQAMTLEQAIEYALAPDLH
jgi:predicted ATPase